MRRLLAGSAAGSVLTLALVACGSDGTAAPVDCQTANPSGPCALTDDEADRLAVVRFNNYKRDLAPYVATVPAGDQVLTITGSADFRDHRAIGSLVTSDVPPTYGVLAWNLRTVGLLQVDGEVAQDELAAVPQAGWQTHDLADEPLDSTLRVLLNLALDRPENAQLLRQNGAQWLGSTVVDGTDVDLMSATPAGQGQTLTYYVDANGNLVRVDVLIAGSDRPATITFPAGTGAEVPVVKALGKDDGSGDGSGATAG